MARRILCVCKGNTCRSPMMEAMLRNEFQKLGMTDVRVESAGVLLGIQDRPAHPDTLLELANRGLSLPGHISRYSPLKTK